MSEVTSETSREKELSKSDQEKVDSVDELTSVRNHRKTKPALRRVAALAFAAALGTIQSPAGELKPNIPDIPKSVEFSKYTPSQISNLEKSYPKLTASDATPKIYDEAASTDVSDAYRHEGLENISFARPTLEISRKVLEADSIKDIDDIARPFFKSLGMDLYIDRKLPEIEKNIVPVQNEDLENLRAAVLSTMSEISITPREVIKLANVSSVVFAHDIFVGKGQAGGVAFMKGVEPGILAIDITEGHNGQADTWHHELGHHLDQAIEIKTAKAFKKSFARLNIPGFIYKDQILRPGVIDEAIQNLKNQRAIKEGALISDYSGVAEVEDIAEIYRSLWRNEGVPSPEDETYGTRVGEKRVIWVEALDQIVPGFKKYMIGLFSSTEYTYEAVPQSIQQYNNSKDFYSR